MREILFATGNPHKLLSAQKICQQFGIEVSHIDVSVDEIQSEDVETIAKDKARKIFEKVNKPIVTSDDSWQILGLNGFPGPYMRSINQWFTAGDWLRLTSILTDRRILNIKYLTYCDESGQKVFKHTLEGVLLKEIKGQTLDPYMTITSLDGGKHSMAEAWSDGTPSTVNLRTAWHEFAEWYSKEHDGKS